MKLIKLTMDLSSMVDDDDYKILSQFKWCAARRSHTCYFDSEAAAARAYDANFDGEIK